MKLFPNFTSIPFGYLLLSRVVQYCRVDSIWKRDLTNRSIRRMVNLYWRFVKWSCRSEKCISLAGLEKYLTLILWHSPCFALSTRSIRSIRRMVNLYWRSNTWNCRSEKCISLEVLRKYLTLILWHSPCFALSIRSIRSIRRMVNLYWRSRIRSDKGICWSEKWISLEGLRKYLTLILWHSPCFALSIRSIRSIRRMVNLYWRCFRSEIFKCL